MMQPKMWFNNISIMPKSSKKPRTVSCNGVSPKVDFTILIKENVHPNSIMMIEISKHIFCHLRNFGSTQISNRETLLSMIKCNICPINWVHAFSIATLGSEERSSSLRYTIQNCIKNWINWLVIDRCKHKDWINKNCFTRHRDSRIFPNGQGFLCFSKHVGKIGDS